MALQGILANQRAAYAEQLRNNPALRMKFAALMSAEEGNDPQARVALAESALNRGVSRGIPSLDKVLSPAYYQPMSDGSGSYARHLAKIQNNPKYAAAVFADMDKALAGSNVSNLATDNASGSVAANSRVTQTPTWTADNKEGFFRKDINPKLHGADNVANTVDWYKRTMAGDIPPGMSLASNPNAPLLGMVPPSGSLYTVPNEGVPAAGTLPGTTPAPLPAGAPPVPAPTPVQTANLPGTSLTSTPLLPGATSPTLSAEFMSPSADPTNVQTAAVSPTPASVATAAAPAASTNKTFAQQLFGEDMKGGKDSPFANLTEGLGQINKATNRVVADTKANEISPVSTYGANIGGSSGASQLLATMLQNRRKNYGMTLTG